MPHTIARTDSPEAAPVPTGRIDAIDLLRGLALVLMVLDHARAYLSDPSLDPLDLERTTPALFLTRWITHYCAPVFLLLAGASARRLAARLGESALSRFLLTRGLWLVFLELTVVYAAWTFTLPGTGPPILGVIWAIGWSMVALAGLVRLPLAAIGAVGLATIAGHDLLDGIDPARLGAFAAWWPILHGKGPTPMGKVVYPLVPWIGVMAVGYVCGGVFDLDPRRRRALLLGLGCALITLSVLLRLANGYGDPRPRTPQPTATLALLSFLDATKYPPSLVFLLMTLGPALIALALFERARRPLADRLATFGRVPLFFYVSHLVLARLLAGLIALALGFDLTLLPKDPVAAGWGFGLPVVYGAWLGIVVALYPACRRYAAIKARRRGGWLSYL
ncbi:MAG: heparan-alpha-glucosaminide N-acetyltransferase domain-containing protein [Albidovulum sp.]